jgi:hypothetical protein
MDHQTNQALCFILEMQKQQALYLDRLHGWIIAIAETLAKQPDLVEHLKQHPFYDQGPLPSLRSTDEMIRNIDALIQQLRLQS